MAVVECGGVKGSLEVKGPSALALWRHLCGFQILGKSWIYTMLPPLPFLDTSKAVSLEHQMSRVPLNSLEPTRRELQLIKDKVKLI